MCCNLVSFLMTFEICVFDKCFSIRLPILRPMMAAKIEEMIKKSVIKRYKFMMVDSLIVWELWQLRST